MHDITKPKCNTLNSVTHYHINFIDYMPILLKVAFPDDCFIRMYLLGKCMTLWGKPNELV